MDKSNRRFNSKPYKIKKVFFKKKLPEVNYKISNLKDYQKSIQLEWLETNGIGGWAGSTVLGTSTRRYHGLLVAAGNAIEDRTVLVANQLEILFVGNSSYNLSTLNFNDTVAPHGFQYLKEYQKSPCSTFIYEINNDHHQIKLSKTVLMIQDQNTTLIAYQLISTNSKDIIKLQIEPLMAVRSYHKLERKNDQVNFDYQLESQTIKVRPKANFSEIITKVSAGQYQYHPRWIENLKYYHEDNRGYDFLEDLFSFGYWNIEFQDDTASIIYSDTTNKLETNTAVLIQEEKDRRKSLIQKSKVSDSLGAKLVLAADQFLVHPRSESKLSHQTMIAGYPWFTDWGRDAMISLPGICLATGKFNEAKLVLNFFAGKLKYGLIPNRIKENQEVEYNSVDASLWYINAVYQYYKATKDKKWTKQETLPVIRQILEAFTLGTINDIKLDSDGLVNSGNPSTQLTWMDAKVGEWVVTPRNGKAVEINALWFNALKIAELFEQNFGDSKLAKKYQQQSELFLKNFASTFWYDQGKYLFDVVRGDFKDASVRPNQVIAISLDFSAINSEQSKKILTIVKNKLLTPYGLRTLAPEDINYRGAYFGDVVGRDASYHQGTVWAWLIGSYCRAILKTYGEASKTEVRSIIEEFSGSLETVGVGSLSEIFDGDFPHKARGCPAQAWSVAEVLDIWKKINR